MAFSKVIQVCNRLDIRQHHRFDKVRGVQKGGDRNADLSRAKDTDFDRHGIGMKKLTRIPNQKPQNPQIDPVFDTVRWQECSQSVPLWFFLRPLQSGTLCLQLGVLRSQEEPKLNASLTCRLPPRNNRQISWVCRLDDHADRFLVKS